MFIGLSVPVFILGSLALALADYLWRLIKPPVPATVPLEEPYVRPFTGGQCDTQNLITVEVAVDATKFGNPQQSPSGQNFNYQGAVQSLTLGSLYFPFDGAAVDLFVNGSFARQLIFAGSGNGWNYQTAGTPFFVSQAVRRNDGIVGECGDTPNPNPTLPIGGSGLPSSPPPILYPPPNSPPNTPPVTPNNNWFPLIAGLAAVAATALTAATAAAAATAATAITAATAAATAATAAIASAPNGSTIQQQSQSQKLSADALVGIAQVLAEIAKQITELEKETRKLKTGEAKKEKDDAKKVIRYDFGSANRDGFIKLYPESNPDSYEATFIDVQIFNIPIGSGKYFGDKSPHFYKYQSLGQIHFVSPTFGILESREIDFARLSLNIPDNCFGFFYHFGLNGVISANLSAFYSKTEKQVV